MEPAEAQGVDDTQTRNWRQTYTSDADGRTLSLQPLPCRGARKCGRRGDGKPMWGKGKGGDGWGPSWAASRTSPEGLYYGGLGEAGQGWPAGLWPRGWGAGPAARGRGRGALGGGWPAVGFPGPGARGGGLAGPTLRPPTPPHSYASTPGLRPSTPAPALGQVPAPGLAPGQGMW